MAWSSAVTEIFKFFNNIFTKVFLTPEDQVKKVVNIYDTLHEILDRTSAQRILIFKAHNGGGIIKPTGELFVTALYEDYCPPFHSTKDQYIKFPVDADYVRMILELTQKKNIELTTVDMPNNKLKGIYVTEGVIASKVFYLRQDKKSIYYMSVASSREWPIGLQTDSILDILVNKIRQNIK